MNIYKYYIDIYPLNEDIAKKLERSSNIEGVYRKKISSYIYGLHHAVKSKSLPIFAVSIGEKQIKSPTGIGVIRVQDKIRLFGKNEGSLVNLVHILNKHKVFSISSNISPVAVVPENVLCYEIVKRVRLPLASKADNDAMHKIESIKNSENFNYINLMTSSNKSKNKKLIRYYYEKIIVERDNYTGKLDGYGFSRHKNKVCLPVF